MRKLNERPDLVRISELCLEVKNELLLGEIEKNIVICQWRADQLFSYLITL